MYWKFILADSGTFESLGELDDARAKSLALILNKGGTFSFQHPLSTPLAEFIVPWRSCVLAYRYNWRASYNTPKPVFDLIWSGYVGGIQEDAPSDTMNVTCSGWITRLGKRIIRREKKYLYTANTWDDSDIIFDIVDEVNRASAPDGYTISKPSGWISPTNIVSGTKLPNEGKFGKTPYKPAYRGKDFEKYANALSIIEELTSIENGCDIQVDPLTRELNTYRKMMTVRDELLFAYNVGPDNLETFSREIDPSSQTNYHLSVGGPGSIPQFAQDAPSQAADGLLEEMVNLSDVTNNNVLLAYSGGEIFVRRTPRITHSFSPKKYQKNTSIPEPFVDYKLGDQGYLSAYYPPRIDFRDLSVRIFAINVTIDDEGNESIGELQVTRDG